MKMGLRETQDPDKRRLIEKSEQHRRELEQEISQISDKTQRILTNALIIGSVLALSYLVVSQLSKGGSKKDKKKKSGSNNTAPVDAIMESPEKEEKNGLLAEIGTKVVNQATLILIDIARQKLMEYLESRKKPDDAS